MRKPLVSECVYRWDSWLAFAIGCLLAIAGGILCVWIVLHDFPPSEPRTYAMCATIPVCVGVPIYSYFMMRRAREQRPRIVIDRDAESVVFEHCIRPPSFSWFVGKTESRVACSFADVLSVQYHAVKNSFLVVVTSKGKVRIGRAWSNFDDLKQALFEIKGMTPCVSTLSIATYIFAGVCILLVIAAFVTLHWIVSARGS